VVQIFHNKKMATAFQILVEVAANQPNIPQKLIAAKVGVTPQAVSEHFRELKNEGYLEPIGRSRYRISPKGVNFVLKMAGELEEYSSVLSKAITKFSITAALANEDITPGQKVALFMKEGLLYAGSTGTGNATGIAIGHASRGSDVGITDVEGIVQLEPGEITIAVIPGIEKGGSAMANRHFLKKLCRGKKMVVPVGLEAIAALKSAGVASACRYAPIQAAIEAAQTGISPLVVCAETELNNLMKRLVDSNLRYLTLDLSREAVKRRRKGAGNDK